ncbi:nucleotide exchange factor GrpE [Actinomadura sp. HBU206391]|uniref:nucleotide exchange factor GrpE n=1 Tax=Actinomadura sp. HBU206391 TaxID=2731692 RepID=UPI0016503D43|nr:nucleotide exchange factor GrpE [Actinomadura sp. HBU206391]MBC6457594.1 nucleotide exchange factor GrpE [Actinomadura sp. HBU206391]
MTERQPDQEHDGPVIRDNRRIDPKTGQVRDTATAPSGSTPAPPAEQVDDSTEGAEVAKLKSQLAERTTDLQRLQAEYANYRKRVERDRVAVREQALANVLAELLPVLDDIGRARDHEELTGGFKSVAEALEAAVGKLGLVRFGEKGEPFDPTVHEALMHSYSADVTEPTCVDVLQPGYRIGERVMRAARVAVAEPDEDAAAGTGAPAAAGAGEDTGAGVASDTSADADTNAAGTEK